MTSTPKYDCMGARLPDEPYFVLLARDLQAPDTVRGWAHVRKNRNPGDAAEREKADEAYRVADAMEVWRKANDGRWRLPQEGQPLSATTAEPLHYQVARQAHETAGKLVQGDRRETHGDFLRNFEAIAELWTGFLASRFGATDNKFTGPLRKPVKLSPLDVADMMVLLKMARSFNGKYNPDDRVDLLGYGMIGAGLEAGQGGI